MEKVYTIKITGTRVGIWYEGKIGEQFDAILWVRLFSETNPNHNIIGFAVDHSPLHFVHSTDCNIISEITKNKYRA